MTDDDDRFEYKPGDLQIVSVPDVPQKEESEITGALTAELNRRAEKTKDAESR